MKLFKKSLIVLFALVAFIQSHTSAQPFFSFSLWGATDRAKEVMQDSEFVTDGKANDGSYFCNPLVLDGKLLDYDRFSLQSKGQLTLVKGVVDVGKVVEIPFHVYLRRNGTIVNLSKENVSGSAYLKIEISDVLKFAKDGDQLIIEPSNKEDWAAKRILKLLDGGC